jgi:chaperone BCS1
MGRVPARCVVLLEDLDAAFTRSTSRDNSGYDDDKDKEKKDGDNADKQAGPLPNRRRRDHLSDVNTLSLSGLLNALDGVAAAEGRLLFATTNHLERLDAALSRPGRMDVWIEFRNASKWQAEALFRNFFPCAEDEPPIDDAELEDVDLKVEVNERPRSGSTASTSKVFVPTLPRRHSESHTPSPSSSNVSSSLWSLASSALGISESTPPTPLSPSSPSSSIPPLAGVNAANGVWLDRLDETEQFGASNTAYRPPPPAESVVNSRHSAAPLDKSMLNMLAKKFADGIPDEEFSVAALQGCKSFSWSFVG